MPLRDSPTYLQHPRTGHHHRRLVVRKVRLLLQRRYVSQLLERVISHLQLFPEGGAHHVEVGVEDGHALADQRAGVEDRNVVELGVGVPVLLEYQQQLLSPSERKDREKTAAPTLHDVADGFGEAPFPGFPLFVRLGSVSRFHNEDVDVAGRELGRVEVAVFFAGVVPGVEYLDTLDLHEEHRGSDHMSRVVGDELDSVVFQSLAVVHQLDLLQGRVDVHLAVEPLVLHLRVLLQIVREYGPVNGLRRVRRVHIALEVRLLRQIRQRPTMIQMKTTLIPIPIPI